MQVYFCDKCQRRITEGDIKRHVAVLSGDKVYCHECISSPELKAVVEADIAESKKKKSSSRRLAKKSRRRTPTPFKAIRPATSRRVTPYNGNAALKGEANKVLTFLIYLTLGLGLGFLIVLVSGM